MRKLAVAISNSNKRVTPIQTIDAIKEAGFENVFIQWYNRDWECNQSEQLEYARKQGLNIIFAHLGYQKINDIWNYDESGDILVEKYKKDIKTCKENNIPMVIMHLTGREDVTMYNETGLRRIQEIVDYAKELNIKVAFENTRVKGYLEYVMQNIKNDNVGICYDAGHCHAHFNDEFNYELFKDKIFAVHLHDNDKSSDQHLIPFDGTINWDNVVSKLKECNYDGPVTLELSYRNDYLKDNVENFYKRGFSTGETLRGMFDNQLI